MPDLPIRQFFSRLPELSVLESLLEHFFGEPGAATPAQRAAAEARAATLGGGRREEAGEPLPESVRRYVDKVALEAYKVVDADVDAMRREGLGEDYIYEITLAATTGASLARLERGLALLEEETSDA